MGNMIKVVIYNNAKKDYAFKPATATIGSILTEAGWDAGKSYMLAGEQLVTSDMDRTLADFGYNGNPGRDTVHISAVAPKANA